VVLLIQSVSVCAHFLVAARVTFQS
jgi:hypothetical protein